mmetsp:Transcript_74863/g.206481  ORF Transcript_74863/g.206481 Transcript_74863/m.206481 type:complete len:99 (-) Transcript_74863:928-1224(-)
MTRRRNYLQQVSLRSFVISCPNAFARSQNFGLQLNNSLPTPLCECTMMLSDLTTWQTMSERSLRCDAPSQRDCSSTNVVGERVSEEVGGRRHEACLRK